MRVSRAKRDRRVCVVGLGPVGLTLAVLMAETGFQVLGIEADPTICQTIAAGRAPFNEVGLDARLAARIDDRTLIVSAAWPSRGEAEVYIVAVGTPLAADRTSNLDAIQAVCAEIAGRLAGGELVVLRSTVGIGISRTVAAPLLARSGVAFDLAFCPERTVQGKALQELQSLPQIVGGRDAPSTRRAAALFGRLTPNVVDVASLEAAETVKLINNSQRDLMFAFANEVAGLCDAAGVDAGAVIRAANLDYPRSCIPAPGPVGGSCLEKDPCILAESGARLGVRIDLPLLGRRINEAVPSAAIARIGALRANVPTRRIAVLGLAYKGRPATDDLRGSLAIPLIAGLTRRFSDAEIVGFDPCVGPAAVEALGVSAAPTAVQAVEDADLVVFQTNHLDFGRLDLTAVCGRMARGGLIYDFWSQFDRQPREFNRVRLLRWGDGAPISTGSSRRVLPATRIKVAPDDGRSRASNPAKGQERDVQVSSLQPLFYHNDYNVALTD